MAATPERLIHRLGLVGLVAIGSQTDVQFDTISAFTNGDQYAISMAEGGNSRFGLGLARNDSGGNRYDWFLYDYTNDYKVLEVTGTQRFNVNIDTYVSNIIDMSNVRASDSTRLSVRGRASFVSHSNTSNIAFFGHPGYEGIKVGGVSEGVTFESASGVDSSSVSGGTMAVWFNNSNANSCYSEFGMGLDRSARLTKFSGPIDAIIGFGRDQSHTTTTRTLVRIANRNPTASLALTGGARYFEVIDYDTDLTSATDIFGIESDRSVRVYTSTDSTDTTSGAFQVVGGAAITENLYVGKFLVPLGNQSSDSNVAIGLNAGTVDNNEIDCVIIGNGAYSDNNYCTVIGRGAFADGGEDNVAIGDYTFANGNNSISIGSFCKVGDDAISERSIHIGADAIRGNHDDSNGIGYGSYLYGNRTQGIGNYQLNGFTEALANDQILLGHGAAWSGANVMQIGGSRCRLTVTLTVPGQNFTDGEVVTGGTSGATARAVDNAFNGVFDLAMTSAANFQVGETITGATSGHTATVDAVDFSTYTSNINTVRFNRGVETITWYNPILFNSSVTSTGFYYGGNLSTWAGSTLTPRVQVNGTSAANAAIAVSRFNSTTTTGPSLLLAQSAGTTVGDYTILSDGAALGRIRWEGSDGTDFSYAASIEALVDGTPGANNIPGRIKLRVWDGSSGLDVIDIRSSGVVNIPQAISSTDTSTGALVVGYGVGIGGTLHGTNADFTTSYDHAVDSDGVLYVRNTNNSVTPGTGTAIYAESTNDSSGLIVIGNGCVEKVLAAFRHNALATSSGNGKAFGIGVTSEGFNRSQFYSDGAFGIGPGNATRDVYLFRIAANQFGIAGSAWSPVGSGGNLRLYGQTSSTSATDGTLIVDGGAGILENLNVGGDLGVGGVITQTDATVSSSNYIGSRHIHYINSNFNAGNDAIASSIVGEVSSAAASVFDLIGLKVSLYDSAGSLIRRSTGIYVDYINATYDGTTVSACGVDIAGAIELYSVGSGPVSGAAYGFRVSSQILVEDGLSSYGIHIGDNQVTVNGGSGDAIAGYFGTVVQNGSGRALSIYAAGDIQTGGDVIIDNLSGSPGSVVVVDGDGKLSKGSDSLIIKTITFVIDGGSSTPQAGAYASVVSPFDGTIIGWHIISDVVGSAVIDIWKSNGVKPTNSDSITDGNKPTLSSSNYANSFDMTNITNPTSLGGWITSVSSGDIFTVELESASTVRRLTIQIEMII